VNSRWLSGFCLRRLGVANFVIGARKKRRRKIGSEFRIRRKSASFLGPRVSLALRAIAYIRWQ